jgi:GNAT superfamily N-acetyltransferase
MLIRLYEPRDRPAVEELTPRLCVGAAAWIDVDAMLASVQRWVRDSLEHAADDEHAVFVAEDAGRVVGFVTAAQRRHFTGAREAYVGELVVAADAEGRGAGRALMGAVEEWARGRGVERVSLETGAANAAARRFYAALGYAEDDVRLSKAVT